MVESMTRRASWVLPGLAAALVFLIVILPAASQAQSELKVGVNRPGLPWVNEERRRTIAREIAAAGFRDLRMMLVPPFEVSLDTIEAANAAGLSVLLMVPLTSHAYYEPPVTVRPGNDHLWNSPPLSKLSIALFKKQFELQFSRMASRKLKVSGIQIGNEFNSAAFNGDLPVTKGGHIVNSDNYRAAPFWSAYVEGLKNLRGALAIAHASVARTAEYKDVPIVLGGLARPTTTWLQNVDATLVEPVLTLRMIFELGAEADVNAFCDPFISPVGAWFRTRNEKADRRVRGHAPWRIGSHQWFCATLVDH